MSSLAAPMSQDWPGKLPWHAYVERADNEEARAEALAREGRPEAAHDTYRAIVRNLEAQIPHFRETPCVQTWLSQRAKGIARRAAAPARPPEPPSGGTAPTEAAAADPMRVAAAATIVRNPPDVGLRDIVGADEAKRHLLVALRLPLQLPRYFEGKRKGWRGILTYGPPGTGKTLLARAAAQSLKCTFFLVSSKDVVSKWVGDSEKFVSALFAEARARAPSVIFVDEVDGLLARRSDVESEARRNVKTQFFADMDGFAPCDRVTVIGATNRPWDLDEAALRRFEKRIFVPLPDTACRGRLFERMLDGLPHAFAATDFADFAARTVRYSGADIRSVVKDASLAPLLRIAEAEAFKRDPAGRLVPCAHDAPGASPAPTDLSELQNERLDDDITRDDVLAAIAASPPPTSADKMQEFADHEARLRQ